MIRFLKNGSGIHIKESQKGSFTKYCKGKVTNECIQKGKNSPDPKIRKKATFAANARKWKHKDRGTIKKFAQGNKVNFWQGFGNFLNSNVGQGLMNIGTNFLSTQAQNKQVEGEAEALKAQNEYNAQEALTQLQRQSQQEANQMYQQWAQNYQQGLIQDQPSDIVAKHLGYKKYSQNLASQQQNLKNQNTAIDAQAQSQKAAQNANFWSSTIQSGLGMVGNWLSNKKGSTT